MVLFELRETEHSYKCDSESIAIEITYAAVHSLTPTRAQLHSGQLQDTDSVEIFKEIYTSSAVLCLELLVGSFRFVK